MKRTGLTLAALLIVLANYAKCEIVKVKIYYDKEWQICKENEAHYFRECHWDTNKNFFDGEFHDYLINGNKIAEGNYSNGKKNGLFTFYHDTGQEWIKGEFKDNIPTGKWIWKYPNNLTHFSLNFESNDFHFMEIFDEQGKDLSAEKVEFKYVFQNDNRYSNILITGVIQNKMKEGKWYILNNNEKVGYVKYKNDKFIESKTNNSYLIVNEQLINNSLFIPYPIYACEKIQIDDDVTLDDYQFLNSYIQNTWKPIDSAIGIIEDSIIVQPEIKPMYINGIEGINKIISKNLILNVEYVKNCKRFGWAYYEITIDEQGNVVDRKILKSPDEIITEIALKSLKSLKQFKPAYYNGKPIKSKFSSRMLFRKPTIVNP